MAERVAEDGGVRLSMIFKMQRPMVFCSHSIWTWIRKCYADLDGNHKGIQMYRRMIEGMRES